LTVHSPEAASKDAAFGVLWLSDFWTKTVRDTPRNALSSRKRAWHRACSCYDSKEMRMDAEVRAAFDELQRLVVGGFDSVERRLDSVDRRVEALERESAHTASLFGQLGESVATLHETMGRLEEQMGRCNARLDRLVTVFMTSKTEATVRHARLEQRLTAIEEKLRPNA
jgi:uncharacterized coiled-coil protein SlyX